MPKKTPKSPPKTSLQLDGSHIAALNEVSPGAGNQIAQILSSIQNVINGQAGHRGTPTLATQEGTDTKGKSPLALDVNGRIGGGDEAIDDTDFPILSQVRRLLNPTVEDEDGALLKKQKTPGECRAIAFSKVATAICGMEKIHAVEPQGEFVYVAGE